MRVRLIWVGKTRNEHLRALIDEYVQRLGRFVRCEIVEVREGTSGEERAIIEEGRRITGMLGDNSPVVLLDLTGRQWSSPELAAELEGWQLRAVKELAFVVGSHAGVSAEVRKRADICWSLSRLTLTHEMARLVLVEQLYRAYTIMRGLPYQK